MAPGSAGRERLRAQSNEFRKEVLQVTDRVYVAIGYSISNVVLIQGDQGAIRSRLPSMVIFRVVQAIPGHEAIWPRLTRYAAAHVRVPRRHG